MFAETSWQFTIYFVLDKGQAHWIKKVNPGMPTFLSSNISLSLTQPKGQAENIFVHDSKNKCLKEERFNCRKQQVGISLS